MIKATANTAERAERILIVDDERANRHLMTALLGRQGYELCAADSGAAALAAAKENPPDLILLDVCMPELSGYDVCERLKSDPQLKDIPVIYLSALTDETHKVKGFAVGGVDYITKPFHVQELSARVQTHLHLHRLQVELEHRNLDLELAQQRLKVDLELARRVQHRLLPTELPELAEYEFFAHYAPAYEVGGDYYDFISLSDRQVAVVLGDVAGKGVAAALLMAKLSADARFCLLAEPDLAAAISRLNVSMCRSDLAGQVATLVAMVLDPDRHTLSLVSAGHPSPLVYSRHGGTIREVISNDSVGLPLGVVEDFEYSASRVSLQPGDSVLAFTDGVIEAMDCDGHLLQTAGVCRAVAGKAFAPRELGAHVIDTVYEFADGHIQQDDIALIGFGRTELESANGRD